MREREHPIVATFLGVVLAASFLIASALADEEGYIDNWPGSLKVELASPDLPQVIPLPAEQAGPPLSERLRLAWVESLSKTCNQIRAGFEQSGGVREWRSCDLAVAGELRARAPSLYPNRLDLKYVIAGNRVQFVAPTPTVLGQWADPFIEVNFKVVIRMTLMFDTRLDLAGPPAKGPISLESGHTGFSEARFRSSWDSIPIADNAIAPSLRDGEFKLNQRIESLLPEAFPLATMNLAIFNGANALRAAVENESTLIPYLGLRTSLRGNDFVMLFSKGSRPAVALPMCTCTSLCGQRIHCTCGGASVLQDDDRVLLQRLTAGGVWTPSGVSDPGSWWVDGDALGAVGGEEVTVRLCSVNQWGRTCGEQLSFVYQNVGLCTPPDPTPTPLCAAGLRPCAGQGCILPSMGCR